MFFRVRSLVAVCSSSILEGISIGERSCDCCPLNAGLQKLNIRDSVRTNYEAEGRIEKAKQEGMITKKKAYITISPFNLLQESTLVLC